MACQSRSTRQSYQGKLSCRTTISFNQTLMCRYFWDVISPANVCPVKSDSQGRCYPDANRPNKFQTHGALIGGPKTPSDAGDPNRVAFSLEGWNDWRIDWVGSEQTLDYNAMYTVALAAAIDLPPSFWKSPCGGELFGFRCLLL